jgi:hypothetical protein
MDLKIDIPALLSGSERTLKTDRPSSSGKIHWEVDGRRLDPEKSRFLPVKEIPPALPLLCSRTGCDSVGVVYGCDAVALGGRKGGGMAGTGTFG